MDKGFIKLSRKLFSHSMWKAARTFSECEAWIDLIQSARFETTETIERIGGRDIKWGRGQYPASNRFLSKKWGWGEQKVKNFLGKLKTEKMIMTDKSQGMNVIYLCNFDEYNSKNPTKNPEGNPSIELVMREIQELKTQLKTQRTTQQQPSDNPNNKKDNKEKNISPYNPPRGYEKFNFDFLDFDFRECLTTWLKYKSAKGQKYKDQESLEIFYKNKMIKASGGQPEIVSQMIEEARSNNWAGLFPLKEKEGGTNEVKQTIRQPDYSEPM